MNSVVLRGIVRDIAIGFGLGLVLMVSASMVSTAFAQTSHATAKHAAGR